eukprot:sb/3463503/
MNEAPQLFLSTTPDTSDFVTIVAETTTSGPHLLNCACSRALLKKSSNLLASPSHSSKRHVYIVIHKSDVQRESFSSGVTESNLKLSKVIELTREILQYCLDFTLHTYLHPSWTRVDNKYFEGKTCLFQNTWMGCIKAQLTVQSKAVALSVRGALVKLLVPKLSSFNINPEIIQQFSRREIRTIHSRHMGDNSCYVLPSFKLALVHNVSYDIPEGCPLKNKRDMIAYWLDYHGILIPSDTDLFITLQFNFPGAPVMTYPYYCIRKGFPQVRGRVDSDTIDNFMASVGKVCSEKIPRFGLDFPSKPSVAVKPNQNVQCLIPLESVKPRVPTKLPDLSPPERIKVKVANTGKRMKPKFAPYSRPAPSNPQNTPNKPAVKECNVPRPVPTFKPSHPVPKIPPPTVFHPIKTSSKTVKSPIVEDEFDDFDIPDSVVRSVLEKHAITTATAPTTTSVALPAKPRFEPRVFQSRPTVDLPQTPKRPTPQLSQGTPRLSQGTPGGKKPKNAPKILSESEVKDCYAAGKISKVNNHSLVAFLKSRNVKGLSKMKKDQLQAEVLKYIEPAREQ